MGLLALLDNLGTLTWVSLAWSMLILIAGVAQLLSTSMQGLSYVWSAAIILTGGLFLFHTQHGTSAAAARATRQHRVLGITLIVAGLLSFVEIISGPGFVAILWPIMLLIASLQLLLYREPEGAYETGTDHGRQAKH